MVGWYLLLGVLLLGAARPPQEGAPHTGAPVAASPAPAAPPVGQSSAPLLAADILRRPDIMRMDILAAVSARVTQTTPELLERQPEYRICLTFFPASPWRSDLISALESSRAWPTDGDLDCRWACVFYDVKGERVLSMYFSGPGGRALINGALVTIDSRVVALLERRCSPLWLPSPP